MRNELRSNQRSQLKRLRGYAKRLLGQVPYAVWRVDGLEILEDEQGEWILRLDQAYRQLRRLLPRYPFVLYFHDYAGLIEGELTEEGARDRLRAQLLQCFAGGGSREKMFIHCMLAGCHLLDEEAVRRIMADLLDTGDPGYRYWLGLDLSYSTFREGTGFYGDFYRDRKRLYQKIARESGLAVPEKRKREKASERYRICVVTYLLSPDLHNSSQRVCAMFANHLVSFADELMVLCTDASWQTAEECRQYPALIRTPRSDVQRKRAAVQAHFRKEVRLCFARGDGWLQRAQNALDILYAFDPTVIIDLSDEYFPFSCIYARDFFVAYEPLRMGISCQAFSRILEERNRFYAANARFNHVVEESRLIDWSLPEWVPGVLDVGSPEVGCASTGLSDAGWWDDGWSDGKLPGALSKGKVRAGLGLPADAFVILTIGNTGSIERELSDAMGAFLRDEPRCVWLLAGGHGMPDHLRQACGDLIRKKRIVEWGFEEDLAGLCAACDVLLRHRTSGGSGGTAMAALQGLPIVMTDQVCDASRWLGLDFSDIRDATGQVQELRKLMEDPDYYRERSETGRKLAMAAIDCEERWRELNELLLAAEREWRTEKAKKTLSRL